MQSVAANFLAGTKRKIQEVFGGGSGSRASSAPNSPKKRKLSMMGTAAMTKKENALAQNTAAQEKARKEAEEAAAQKASREDRALKRSTSSTLLSKRTTKTSARHSLPATISRRKTIMNISKRSTPKTLPRPGALKATRKSLGSTSMISRSASSSKKGSATTRSAQSASTRSTQSSKKSSAPARSPSPMDVDDEDDKEINITPASLRSASRKLKQTKLPFKALNLTAAKKNEMMTYEVPDSDEEEAQFAIAPPSKRVKTNAGAGKPAEVKKTVGRGRGGRPRASSGKFTKAK